MEAKQSLLLDLGVPVGLVYFFFFFFPIHSTFRLLRISLFNKRKKQCCYFCEMKHCEMRLNECEFNVNPGRNLHVNIFSEV